MTGTEVDIETQAERIAQRGREALLERTRRAYDDAAAAHADLISLPPERIEAMAQSAAERADGLQWRRALASAAAEELGLSPVEALSHPAVLRAQALVGAPSYEQSLAELMARPVPLPTPVSVSGPAGPDAAPSAATEPSPPAEPAPTPAAEAALAPEPAPAPDPAPAPEPTPAPEAIAAPEPADEDSRDQLETVEAGDVMVELLPEPDPIEYETEVYDVEGSFAQESVAPPPANPFAAGPADPAALPESALPVEVEPEAPSADPNGPVESPLAEAGPGSTEPEDSGGAAELMISAIHLGGVANLPTKREGLRIRMSADGLDIMQGEREIIGRLVWDEIEALEVPHLRVRRRSRGARARLVVRTPHGDASFDVPDIQADELRDRVQPIIGLYQRD